MIHNSRFCLVSGFLVLLLGCSGKPIPQFVVTEGTLMLDGKPLPLALVEFMPDVKNFGAEVNSTAVTDANGKFVMICGNTLGAMVATHRVVINEGPPPAGTRGQDAESQTKLAEYTSKLTNRPIPANYGNFSSTPLRVEITAEKRDHILNMKK
ncbi:MAG: hypothetical protein JNJ77_07965 [Planctomycetia bacterium]|nr:hypothetical protein [Planctomycetia bacterium]